MMLVVFGPKNSEIPYFDNKIRPVIDKTNDGCSVFTWKQGNRAAMFYGSKFGAEALYNEKGWFIGYSSCDELPKGYEKKSKTILDICYELWRIEGVDFLKRLNGSFNLFLYDRDLNKSILSTDRFGTYPLWMAKLEDGGIAFSPNYDLLVPMVKRGIDDAMMWSFVARWRPVGTHTLLDKIEGIRQGTAISFDKQSGLEMVEWYHQLFKPEPHRSLNYWAGEFNRCLRESTEKFKDEKSLGVLLSGGIDSRLIASYCPRGTNCITLADSETRQMKIAEKIAKLCGHRHIKVIRDINWYPDTVIPAAKQNTGLWRWNHSHFLMFRDYPGPWQQIDCMVTGVWFDTFFKGAFTPLELWSNTPAKDDIDEAIQFCLGVDAIRCRFLDQVEEVMLPGKFHYCRKAHQKVLSEELHRAIPNASCLIDAWNTTQFGSVYRCSAFPNVNCIRPFKRVRNVIFDNSFYDLYLRTPAIVRQYGGIVRRALWQRDKRLSFLMDSNSCLPAAFPPSMHTAAIKTRGNIAQVKMLWFRSAGIKDYKSGGWPHYGRLWAHNPKMKKIMSNIIGNPTPLLEEYFNIDAVRNIWKKHQEGGKEYHEILDAIAGLGLLDV